MLSCKALAQQHASDYLDNTLLPRQRFGVRVHLMLCGNCRRFVKQLKVVRGVLRGRTLPTAEDQVQSIAARIHSAYHEQNTL